MATTEADARILAHRMILAHIMTHLPEGKEVAAQLLPKRSQEPTDDPALAAFREEITVVAKLVMNEDD